MVEFMNAEMRGIRIVDWAVHPANASPMRTDVDLSLWELEVEEDPATILAKIAEWNRAEYVKMVLQNDGSYFKLAREEVNAKEFCDDVWAIRDGHRLVVRMLLRGAPSPYNVFAALMGRASWIEAAQHPAVRREAFLEVNDAQYDFFRDACVGCGKLIPVNVFDQAWDDQYCPRCEDRDWLKREVVSPSYA
jgi:hypothetical protein